MAAYCDVSLPVPLDRPFTYELPEWLQNRTLIGCRVLVPFGPRKLTGIVLRQHDDKPDVELKRILKALDPEPVLDGQLLALGQWVAHYYCCPLGEVLRGMTPLAVERRVSHTFSLTSLGRDAVRRLLSGTESVEASVAVLKLLEARPLTAAHLTRKVPQAEIALRALMRKGLVDREEQSIERDPLRAAPERLELEWPGRPPEGKFNKGERELLAYLELHPGVHNLAQVVATLPKAATAARTLARRHLLALRIANAAHSKFGGSTYALNASQQAAFEQVEQALQARRYETFLLHGVTGSGKTEVYLHAIEATLALGRSALLLVPEIGLTPAVAGQFFHRFGSSVAILHSAFHDMERVEQWRRIRSGDARVVVGTRSAVFAPMQDLGLLIVDEEHDASYKQQENPRYNGRDVAVVRAQSANAVALLGSATPSLESRYNVERGKFTLLEMQQRIAQRPLPKVEIIDMRTEFLETRKQANFSRRLVEEVQGRLASGEQTMLLLNRRGFAAFVACRACGERLECINCALTLTFHRRDYRMLCHYCGYAERVPQVCPKCQSEHIQFLGVGSERVEDELHRDFPKARIARMDRDTVNGKRQYENILHAFREGSYDILVGTQMIAKGHDVPNVTLVGVVSSDIGLGMPDFRAAERCFQLLTQAAGRAGRGELPGIVLLQTLQPDHYAIRYAAKQDYDGFYLKEIEFRRQLRYPPFAALANILVRAKQQEQALRYATEAGRFLSPPPANMQVLGPAPAPVPRLQGEYRYQMLLKASDRKALNSTLHALRAYAIDQKWSSKAMIIDVDPLTLL